MNSLLPEDGLTKSKSLASQAVRIAASPGDIQSYVTNTRDPISTASSTGNWPSKRTPFPSTHWLYAPSFVAAKSWLNFTEAIVVRDAKADHTSCLELGTKAREQLALMLYFHAKDELCPFDKFWRKRVSAPRLVPAEEHSTPGTFPSLRP